MLIIKDIFLSNSIQKIEANLILVTNNGTRFFIKFDK
jgi:hypothetical protein